MESNRQRIHENSGCTANVVLITRNKIFVANAGDSRAVLCRNGKTIELSKDHKPQLPGEFARIKEAGGKVVMGRVNGGLNLTRSFGDFEYKGNKKLTWDKQMITACPDITQFERSVDDQFILMGCDGIWEKFETDSTGMIKAVLKSKKSGEKDESIIENLLDSLVAEDTSSVIGCDNMTAILVTFS